MNERSYIEVDLDNVKNNILEIKSLIANNTKIICVVKANAYGHGACEVSRAVEDFDCVLGFAVATAKEAIELREFGIAKKILLLAPALENEYEVLISHNIDLCVFQLENAIKLAKIAQRLNAICNVHIKIDIGMSRIGIVPDDNGYNIVNNIHHIEGINIIGIYSHFPNADVPNDKSTNIQLKVFNDFSNRIEKEICSYKLIKHIANSAAIISQIGTDLDCVRAGIILYGIMPAIEINSTKNIMPVMAIKSHVIHAKTVPKDVQISYGGSFTTKKETKIATISIGYGDGYPRDLSNKGWVLIRGQRANIVGRVCMDQLMVDITEIEGVVIGDIVTLVGNDGDDAITMEMLGELSNHFHYEIPCCITPRVERYYN